jgi:hypothetical protein
MERPGERKPNLETFLRLASAFDVALQVRFVPFSRFVDDDDLVDFDNFYVRPFAEDIAHLEALEEQMRSAKVLSMPRNNSALAKELMSEGQPGMRAIPVEDTSKNIAQPQDEPSPNVLKISRISSESLSSIAS